MHFASTIFKGTIVASLLAWSVAANASEPVRPGNSMATAGVTAATAAQGQRQAPRANPNRPRHSTVVLAAVAAGMGGWFVAAAASRGKSNASPN